MFRVGKSNKTDAPDPAQAQPPQTQQQYAPAQNSTAQTQQPSRPQPVAAPPATGGVTGATTATDSAASQPAQPRAQQAESQASATRAVSESEALAKAVKDGAVGGFVGNSSALSGEINFRGMMRVDGHVTGRVVSDDGTLIVSSGGRVEAEVSVAVVKVSGLVTGNISATVRVELGRTARVTGDIQTPALVVEDGAVFDGNCRMHTGERAAAGADGQQRSRTAA